ncbi:hypothetical protein BRAS3843_2050007 [Bradyrhizobium sp. STM 3843]|nr:hypothetical protein BRAS3843_2050007 [Bradyrhizobium sp. STM 3843]
MARRPRAAMHCKPMTREDETWKNEPLMVEMTADYATPRMTPFWRGCRQHRNVLLQRNALCGGLMSHDAMRLISFYYF